MLIFRPASFVRGSVSFVHHNLISVRFATKKTGGSSRNGRDSPGQRLGLKKSGGQIVAPGNIILRQRGQKYHAGENVGMGRDHTLFALTPGWVKFKYDLKNRHQVVSVSDFNPNPISTKIITEGISVKDLINRKRLASRSS